uniref:Uncharacterized protein n=1 Tax=Utricularia reniformis TaxID=192314 RepID=A0A1Y0B162_9LAMI|nr:hypothetical protein AEK19_MT0956 [Utricularia reniformis]ART31182.1 hypothetical protein AEK19_MT0956 [Utricularia reniformis]
MTHGPTATENESAFHIRLTLLGPGKSLSSSLGKGSVTSISKEARTFRVEFAEAKLLLQFLSTR